MAHRPLPAFERTALSNDIPVYLLPYGSVPVAEVQVVFKAGKAYQDKIGQASYTARMLSEGTANHTSQQLAEKLDEHGSWIHHDQGAEYISVNLTSLVADLPETLPLLAEVLLEPGFPEEEFVKLKSRNLQQLQVKEEKTTTVARRVFGHMLYGANHPYGIHLRTEELNLLDLIDLETYYKRHLQLSNAFIIVSGNFDRIAMLAQLEKVFGTIPTGEAPALEKLALSSPKNEKGLQSIHREGPQSTIRVGHLGVDRNHPDYYGLEMLVTALGGYFGSRLMKKIREEKGYTYGIYGAWAANRHAGHLVIQTDVANDYVEDTLNQIKLEMRRLQNEAISQDELSLLQNYMLGKGLRARETPFQLAETLRYSLVYDIPFPEMDRGFEVIQHISPEELQALAVKHFQPDGMLEVVVGG
jgi:predicted Zn-dependent peptidase